MKVNLQLTEAGLTFFTYGEWTGVDAQAFAPMIQADTLPYVYGM